jgi:hypothetical protein
VRSFRSRRPVGGWSAAATVAALAALGLSACATTAAPKVAATVSPTAGQAGSGPVSSSPASADPAAASPAQPAALPVHPVFESSDPSGAWNNDGFIVYNNEWNKGQFGPQTIWANSYTQWGVKSRQASTTSVKVYPSVQMNYGNNPTFSSFTTLSSTFSEAMPSAGNLDAEAAYDILFNHFTGELMIWVDNHGQTPAGGVVKQLTIDNQHYDLYEYSPHDFSFVLTGTQETSGRVNILSFLRWMVSRNFFRGSFTMSQVDFGWEIASTGNVPLNFSMSDYSLVSTPSGTPSGQ